MHSISKELYFKWTILVWLNAILGFVLGYDIHADIIVRLGVIMGVCVFIPIYAMIDNYATHTNNHALKKSLLIGLIIRAISQLFVWIDAYAGILAVSFVDAIGLLDSARFWTGFLLTVLTGAILSFLVAIMTSVIMVIIKLINAKNKTNG